MWKKSMSETKETQNLRKYLYLYYLLLPRTPGTFTLDDCSDSDASAITFHEIITI